ncbi:hypothetical protein pipiens_003747 [Culex pipiens pipiens]|uniref:Odorant receptor n=1 Tax=Culex pipiens pipiens TaxID=38569 RepID=A0ABD1CTJ2_CULPP
MAQVTVVKPAFSDPARELFDRIFSNVSRLYGLIGMNVLDPRYRIRGRTLVPWVVTLFATIQVAYFLWRERADLLKVMVILPYATFPVQGLHVMLQSVTNPSNFKDLQAKSTEVFELLNENLTNRPRMAKVLKVATFLQKMIIGSYGGSNGFIMVAPFIVWLISGTKSFIFLYRIPGVDEWSTVGFLMNLALHAFIIPIAYCKYVGIDCLFIAMIVPIAAYVDGLVNEIEEINDLMEQAKPDQKVIRTKLIRIAKLHQLLLEYEQMLEDRYNFMALVRIGSIVLGIISTIVAIYETGDHMAAFFSVFLLMQLTQNCLLGTVITIKNEKLTEALYDIKWYQLPGEEAKQLTLMLQAAQNAPTLTIGKIGPLDVESYESIMRSIYNFVMALFAFVG